MPSPPEQSADVLSLNTQLEGPECGSVRSDYPAPISLNDEQEPLLWNEDRPRVENYTALGERLSACGDLYRHTRYAGGLILAGQVPSMPPIAIEKGADLAAVIVDRVPVDVIKDGKRKGGKIPTADLNTVLKSEVFLQKFRPVDQVTQTPLYLNDFFLTRLGYNDGGPGNRILYVGGPARIERHHATIDRFLDVMAFAGPADRTNAVGAAITVMLRNHFVGAKPLITVTATKSHAGKDTVVLFAAGRQRLTTIGYQGTDWAFERTFVGAVKHNPEIAVLAVENARLGVREKMIASAFLERFITSPEVLLFSTGTGPPVLRKNDIVVAASTNYGLLSSDLMNRGIHIHLTPVGNVADRESPIGNPKYEFLPANSEEIEAELRGMVENWRDAGCPRDTSVRHPFTEWAATIGGILQVNGFDSFLANYSMRRTEDDPLRKGLGLLGAASPDRWLAPGEWATLAADLGLTCTVVPLADRDSDKGRARGIGIVLTAHDLETFETATVDERFTLRLEKARRRFEAGQRPSTRYRFVTESRAELPEDPDPDQNS